MKIATFNANSIRVREGIVLEWLLENEPDALLIQETKCEDHQFPLASFEEAGWQVAMDGQKSYNGVAIVSRHPIENVSKGFGDPAMPDDKRILCATVAGVRVINTYVPNGTKIGSEKFEYKLRWLEKFRVFAAKQMQQHPNIVWAGDINIAPEPIDVYDSKKVYGGVGHHPEEFERLAKIIGEGWCDAFRYVNQSEGQFTYWDFVVPRALDRNLGWRIDHLYVPEGIKAAIQDCQIDRAPRALERPSDHTFVTLELDI